MHGTCTKRLYFHFRSKIWRHHHVPRPRFPVRRENFGDSHTFKADIGLLNICMGFRTSWPKMGRLRGQKRGRGGAILTPNEFVLTFGGWWFLHLCQRNATVRVLADGQTNRLRDANQLSHAICYSYEKDNNCWYIYTPVKLEQNDIKIANLSWSMSLQCFVKQHARARAVLQSTVKTCFKRDWRS